MTSSDLAGGKASGFERVASKGAGLRAAAALRKKQAGAETAWIFLGSSGCRRNVAAACAQEGERAEGRRGCAGAGSSAERHVVSVLNARGRAGAAALLRHAGATLPSGVAWNKNAPAAEAPGRFVGRRRPFTSA